MATSVAEHTNCTVDPEHAVVLIGVRVNAAKVHVITQLHWEWRYEGEVGTVYQYSIVLLVVMAIACSWQL